MRVDADSLNVHYGQVTKVSAFASLPLANPLMNLRTHISRSNGYRELGMFDESILELEEIEGEDRWHPSVV